MGQKYFFLGPSLRCKYRVYEIVIWVFLTWHSLTLRVFLSLFTPCEFGNFEVDESHLGWQRRTCVLFKRIRLWQNFPPKICCIYLIMLKKNFYQVFKSPICFWKQWYLVMLISFSPCIIILIMLCWLLVDKRIYFTSQDLLCDLYDATHLIRDLKLDLRTIPNEQIFMFIRGFHPMMKVL
jgi:hypothetical protein